MSGIYASIMKAGEPLLKSLLEKRCRQGKEDRARLPERMGVATRDRPEGKLVWLHAASVGEAQSALILVNALLKNELQCARHILVTTGTVTSARQMEKNLPDNAFHQFYPLDHPDWVKRFLDHWRPDLVLWMESELWPQMLCEIGSRKIPAALVNARLSDRTFKRWKIFGGFAHRVLAVFTVILTQTKQDESRFRALGAKDVITTDNLKFSAVPLPCDTHLLQLTKAATNQRPLWLYASSHAGEEELACRVHQILKNSFPDLLTIIVPRHPSRRDEIIKSCEPFGLAIRCRGEDKALPQPQDDIYIADTMGELGLFYRIAPIACIGRSFSNDGGGGHNPIEAAQLNCAVLHGPHVQYQQQIFDEMDDSGASLQVNTEAELADSLRRMLGDPQTLAHLQKRGRDFAAAKEGVLDRVLSALAPALESLQT